MNKEGKREGKKGRGKGKEQEKEGKRNRESKVGQMEGMEKGRGKGRKGSIETSNKKGRSSCHLHTGTVNNLPCLPFLRRDLERKMLRANLFPQRLQGKITKIPKSFKSSIHSPLFNPSPCPLLPPSLSLFSSAAFRQ